MKARLKKFLKESPLVFNLLAGLISYYLRFCYYTSKWDFIWPKETSKEQMTNQSSTLYALWHNKLAYSLHAFDGFKSMGALVSPHSDGRIISSIIRLFNHKIVEGSSNKNATLAIRKILQELAEGTNIVITPDGPRGPLYEINSAITRIAYKYNYKLYAVSIEVSKSFVLNSWDKMLFPKPFAKITVKFSEPIILTGDEETDKILLKNGLLT